MNEVKDLLDRDHLHVDELVDGVRCAELLTANTDRLEHIWSEDILP